MPINRNTLMRIRVIDECLQRKQRVWTLEDLREACEKELLEKEGICGISIRTIQRDIELMRSDKLGYNAPIIVKNKKYYAYEEPDYSITKLPLSQNDLILAFRSASSTAVIPLSAFIQPKPAPCRAPPGRIKSQIHPLSFYHHSHLIASKGNGRERCPET